MCIRDSSKGENGFLTKESLLNIISEIAPKLKKRAETLIKKCRADRRRAFDNVSEYIKIYFEFMDQLGVLNEEETKKICRVSSIDLTGFKKSYEYYLKSNDQDIMKHSAEAMLEKTWMMPTKTVSRQKALEVFKYQLDNIKTEMKKISSDPNNADLLMREPEITEGILEARLADLVHKKFGYEQEDVLESVLENKLQNEKEYLVICDQITEAIIRFLETDSFTVLGGSRVMRGSRSLGGSRIME
eukprot:TRINITY_DN10444_c0_g1_i3.p1 TRINITY_DN10444_c0_g1~~TRINITY_DN10444_c0_g1_i3.p1  ORF type:complete len:244 (-),score=47.10 TRINITY_DN10444_c0_g1_i3:128-859(-)